MSWGNGNLTSRRSLFLWTNFSSGLFRSPSPRHAGREPTYAVLSVTFILPVQQVRLYIFHSKWKQTRIIFCFKKLNTMYNMCVFLGLPKPAIVNNYKAMSCSLYWQTFGYNENDIGYAVTPLYHSASTNMCLFNTIERGTDLRFNHILWYISCHRKLLW